MAVTAIEHGDQTFKIVPQGWYKLLSSKRELTFRYDDVASVEHDTRLANRSDDAESAPGVKIPFLLKAGTFERQKDRKLERSFWVRRKGNNCITIHLRPLNDYNFLCVEVDDPKAEVDRFADHAHKM